MKLLVEIIFEVIKPWMATKSTFWSGLEVLPTWTAPSKLQCFSLKTAMSITFALIDLYVILIGGVSLPARNFVVKLQDGGLRG